MECAFGVVGKILMRRFDGIYFVRFGGDIDFEVISITENSNEFQKTRFWKEKSVEDMDEFTLGPSAQATLVDLSMKEGSLFCTYEIHRTGMLQIVFLVSLESSQRGGVHGLGFMTFGLVVQKFLNIE